MSHLNRDFDLDAKSALRAVLDRMPDATVCAQALAEVAGYAVGTVDRLRAQGRDVVSVALSPLLMGQPANLPLWRTALKLAVLGLRGADISHLAMTARAVNALQAQRASRRKV